LLAVAQRGVEEEDGVLDINPIFVHGESPLASSVMRHPSF
jgi:hypothetical protein